jgi:hypothetical protein
MIHESLLLFRSHTLISMSTTTKWWMTAQPQTCAHRSYRKKTNIQFRTQNTPLIIVQNAFSTFRSQRRAPLSPFSSHNIWKITLLRTMNSIITCSLNNQNSTSFISGRSSRSHEVFQSAVHLHRADISCTVDMACDDAILPICKLTSTVVSGLQGLQCHVYDHGIMISWWC